MLLFNLFMLRVFLAPLAVLFELEFLRYCLLVFARPVVDALARAAGKFYEFLL